jgi:hypothetical protein
MIRLALWLMIFIFLAMLSSAGELESDLQKKLERGQDIVYKDLSILDDLKFNDSKLSKDANNRTIVNSSLRFENCEIKGNISLGLAVFKKPVIFRSTRFSGNTNFAKSKFDNDCIFSDSEFKMRAQFDRVNFTNSPDFRRAQFENTANFEGSVFQRAAYFIGTKFLDDAIFRGSSSKGPLYFTNAEFDKSAIFSQANFENGFKFQSAKFLYISEFEDGVAGGDTNFMESSFGNDANFHNVTFQRDARFDSAEFQHVAKFSNSTFGRDAIFTGSKFDGPADFSYTNFLGISRFDGAEFNKIVKFINSHFSKNVSFFNAYFDRDGRFEGASFGSSLNLTDATFSRLALSWEEIRDHLVRNKGTNISLINNYKSMGWIKDRNQCYYDYRNERRISSAWGPSRALDSASWLYWGYGVRPYDALRSIFLIIIIFAIIYYWLVYKKFATIIRKSDKARNIENPASSGKANLESKAIAVGSESADSGKSLSLVDALNFSGRTLLFRSPGNIQIEGRYANYAIWIQKAIFGFFVALFIVFFNQELQSYFRPPT